MWEMPLWMLIGLVITIPIAMYFLLRPLKVLSGREWALSHAFIIIGLVLISVWLWLNRGDHLQTSMLIGGLWTIMGGICFAVTYVIRKSK
jgi:hypothetical protein